MVCSMLGKFIVPHTSKTCVLNSNLGQLHQSQGQVEETLYYFERHVALTTKTDNPDGLVFGLRNLARACLAIGRYEAALTHYTRLLGLAEKRDEDSLARECLAGMSELGEKITSGVKVTPEAASRALAAAAELEESHPRSKR